MDVRCFPRRQDALSVVPDGSANPVRSTGRAGGCVSLRQVSLRKQREAAQAVTARNAFEGLWAASLLQCEKRVGGVTPTCDFVWLALSRRGTPSGKRANVGPPEGRRMRNTLNP